MTRFKFIRAQLAAGPPRAGLASMYACAAVVIPTLIRAVLDPYVSSITFVTYYPFVLLSALFLGGTYALGVGFASAIAANFLFMTPRYTLLAQGEDTLGTLLFLLSSGLVIALGDTLRRTVRELEEGRRREAELNRELQHRVKNTLAVVQGLATQTFRSPSAGDAALRTFKGRLHALAQAHDVLTGGKWEMCQLPDLASRALAPFNQHSAVNMEGPPCALPEASCVPLVLALHELGTNAVKYGALSTLEGSVEVIWDLRDADDGVGQELLMRWVERHGPVVQPPTRRGLGSRLLAAQRGLAAVTLDFRPEGLGCEIVVADARPLAVDMRVAL